MNCVFSKTSVLFMLFPFMFYMVEGKKKEANEKNLAKSLEVNIRSLGRKEKACEDFKRLCVLLRLTGRAAITETKNT